MNKQQMQDREQFRRYAEAALSAMNPRDFSGYDRMAAGAFQMAINMMLSEGQHWERYQLQALSAIVDDERVRHEGK
jgi:hypothetical protein